MRWFRRHVKLGARLAFLALAVQFALSFGHFHRLSAHAAPALHAALAQVDPSPAGAVVYPETASELAQKQRPSNHHRDQQPNDGCAICAVVALAGSIVFATPPVLLVPQAAELLLRSTRAEFVHLNAASVAFQSRAPPLA